MDSAQNYQVLAYLNWFFRELVSEFKSNWLIIIWVHFLLVADIFLYIDSFWGILVDRRVNEASRCWVVKFIHRFCHVLHVRVLVAFLLRLSTFESGGGRVHLIASSGLVKLSRKLINVCQFLLSCVKHLYF